MGNASATGWGRDTCSSKGARPLRSNEDSARSFLWEAALDCAMSFPWEVALDSIADLAAEVISRESNNKRGARVQR